MITKGGEDIFPDILEGNERPPPFNPDSPHRSSSSASFPQTDTNHHPMLHQDHQQEQYQPPPYYDSNFDEPVVWDENLSSDYYSRHSRDTNTRSFHEEEEEHYEMPTTPRNENGEYVTSPSHHSPQKYWQSTKQVAKNTWQSVKSFEEKHELTTKTKQGAKTVLKSTKRATMSGVRKIRELDEKHGIMEKSKQGVMNGATFLSQKCRGAGRRQTL